MRKTTLLFWVCAPNKVPTEYIRLFELMENFISQVDDAGDVLSNEGHLAPSHPPGYFNNTAAILLGAKPLLKPMEMNIIIHETVSPPFFSISSNALNISKSSSISGGLKKGMSSPETTEPKLAETEM